MKGKVKFYNPMKRFGFITGEDGKEYFVHKSALKPGAFLKENDEVTFDGAESERGLQAQNVENVGGSSRPQRGDFKKKEESYEETSEESSESQEDEYTDEA
jgi:CspA family cold shock protein